MKLTWSFFIAGLFLLGCKKNESTEILPYITLWQDSASVFANEIRHYHELQIPEVEPDTVFDAGWLFVQGNQDEVLKAVSFPNPDSAIELPHRIVLPNTALWYKKIVPFAINGMLHISADDGAQVWINRKLALRVDGNYFKIETSSQSEILVRVLNNAMAGGLRQVEFYNQTRFDSLQNVKNEVIASRRKLEKQLLLNDSTSKDKVLLVGPWITQSDSVVVRAYAEEESPVTLRWGLSATELSHSITKSDERVSYAIPKQSVDWYYKLESQSTQTPVYKVEVEEPQFDFSVWGDSQSGWHYFQQHVKNLRKHNDAFTIGVGDLVGNGSDSEAWRSFFGILSTYAATRPAYLIAGNHDYDGSYDELIPETYQEMAAPHGKSYFSWVHQNCAFIALDPNAQFPIGFSNEQQLWFTDQVQSDAWKNATWRFVLLHQPPYSQGWSGYQGDAVVQNLLEPVLESGAIDFVIAGHTHDYERLTKRYAKGETTFLISGGGGGSLEPEESSTSPKMDTVVKKHHVLRFNVAGSRLVLNVLDLNDKLIEQKRFLK